MYTSNTYEAEIAYRRDRIRSSATSRRTRAPFVRRPAESRRATS